MATLPSLTQSFSLLQKQPTTPIIGATQTSTPATTQPAINWNAINVKPAAAAPTFKLPTSAPAMPSLNMSIANSTPATMTPISTFKSPVMPNTSGNVQSQDTALRPGQFGAGPFNQPAQPSIASTPTTTTTPVPTRTSDGLVINPETGGVQSNAASVPEGSSFGSNTGNASSASNYSASAGGAPTMPYTGEGSYNPLIQSKESEDAYKKYLESMQPSQEELDAEKRLDNLNIAAATAYTNTQNQPIALPFITGQQAAQQRSASLLAAPLEAQLTRLQAKRQIASNVSKTALERADAMTKARRELATSTVSIPFGSTAAQFNSATGKFEPIGGSVTAGGNAAIDSWVSLIKGGQAKLEDVPQQIRQQVAEGMTKSTDVSRANQDAIAQGDTVIQKIDSILNGGAISALTTGAGAYLANVKGTPAYNLAAELDTIKSNVGFAALQAMRAASPTGGALGQVSEQENRLLQSTLASLDQGQGAEQLKANLAKVKLHFENMKKVLSAPINSQVSYDSAGNVIIKAGSTGGAFNSQSSGSTGSGGLWDW